MRHSSVIRSTMSFVVLIAATEAWIFGPSEDELRTKKMLIDQKHEREMATIKATREIKLSEEETKQKHEETKQKQLEYEMTQMESKKWQIVADCVKDVSLLLIIGVCVCLMSWLIYKYITHRQNADQIINKHRPVNLNVNNQADPSTNTGRRTTPSNDHDDGIVSGAPTTKENYEGKPDPLLTKNANSPNNGEQQQAPSSSTESDLYDDDNDDTDAGKGYDVEDKFNSTSDVAGARRRRLLKC